MAVGQSLLEYLTRSVDDPRRRVSLTQIDPVGAGEVDKKRTG